MLVAACLVNALGILSLVIADSLFMYWTYSIVLGLGVGMTTPCVIPMIASYFGNKNFGAIQGSVLWLTAATAGLCPLVMGYVADKSGYVTGFLVGAAICLVGGILAWAAKPPKVPAKYKDQTNDIIIQA
jgi:MFS family permease